MKEFINLLREYFYLKLAVKTGWERKEIKSLFEECVNDSLMEFIDRKAEGSKRVKKITLYDTVKKLTEPYYPVGQIETDKLRYENLETLIQLVDSLLIDIGEVARFNKDSPEDSRKKAGEYAYKFLTEMNPTI